MCGWAGPWSHPGGARANVLCGLATRLRRRLCSELRVPDVLVLVSRICLVLGGIWLEMLPAVACTSERAWLSQSCRSSTAMKAGGVDNSCCFARRGCFGRCAATPGQNGVLVERGGRPSTLTGKCGADAEDKVCQDNPVRRCGVAGVGPPSRGPHSHGGVSADIATVRCEFNKPF